MHYLSMIKTTMMETAFKTKHMEGESCNPLGW